MRGFNKRLPKVGRWAIGILTLITVWMCCWWVWEEQMVRDVGPMWRGITVGRSTVDEVIATLGAPTSIKQEGGQIALLYQEGRFEWAIHRIIIHNGVVVQITEDMSSYFPDKVELLQFIDKYGIPDCVMWSSKTPIERIAIFLDEGVFVSATGPLDKAEVTFAVYYQPRPLVRLLVDFKDEMSLVNPFPDSDIIGPRDPWFGTP